MRKKLIRWLSVACVVGVWPLSAWGQSGSTLQNIQRQQEHILQQNEQHLDQLERERQERERASPPIETLPSDQPLPEGGGMCFVLKEVVFQGADHLSESNRAMLTSSWLGRCVTLKDLEQIVRATSNFYGERGFVTTRAYLLPQDISGGRVKIVVVEGKIEGFDWNGEKADEQSEVTTAFPGLLDDRLNIRDIEQGLDQINRLHLNNAKLKLIPGTNPGESRVAVENERSKSWEARFGLDNTGTKSTGERQGSSDLISEDMFGFNESLSGHYNHDLLENSSERLSRTWVFNASLPYGYWNVDIGGNGFQYQAPIQGHNQTFKTSGMSRGAKIQIGRVLHRDSESKTNAGVSVNFKNSRNYIEDVLIESASRKLAFLGFSLGHSRTIFDGSFSIDAQLSSGLHALGSPDDSQRQSWEPEAQFEKWELDLGYRKSIPFFGLNLTGSVLAHGQWSDDILFATEQISIGSETTVRGYKEQALQGNSGGYVRTELSLPLPTGNDFFDQEIGVLRPFVAYDIGGIKRQEVKGIAGGYLSGWATGVSFGGKWIEGKMTYAHPLWSDSSLVPRSHEIYGSISLIF